MYESYTVLQNRFTHVNRSRETSYEYWVKGEFKDLGRCWDKLSKHSYSISGQMTTIFRADWVTLDSHHQNIIFNLVFSSVIAFLFWETPSHTCLLPWTRKNKDAIAFSIPFTYELKSINLSSYPSTTSKYLVSKLPRLKHLRMGTYISIRASSGLTQSEFSKNIHSTIRTAFLTSTVQISTIFWEKLNKNIQTKNTLS